MRPPAIIIPQTLRNVEQRSSEIIASTASRAPQRASLADFLAEYDRRASHAVFTGPRYAMTYSTIGTGPPVYIVPGICSTRRLFAPLLVELGRSFRAVVYDLPGTGEYDGVDPHQHDPDDYQKDLFALADHLGDGEFFAVAVSFGTTITVRAMLARPERIRRAMLVAGFAHRPLGRWERLSLRMLQHWPGRLRHIPWMRQVSRYNHGRELDLREAGLIDFLISQSGSTRIRTTAAQVLAVDRTDLRQYLSKVKQPVMVVHGMSDRLVPTRHAGELARCLPNVQILLIPDCGHMPHLSHPELLAHAARRLFLGQP